VVGYVRPEQAAEKRDEFARDELKSVPQGQKAC
jgi:hypothetical protein